MMLKAHYCNKNHQRGKKNFLYLFEAKGSARYYRYVTLPSKTTATATATGATDTKYRVG